MADHSYYEELIGCELDGELTSDEAAALHTHLEACEQCRRYRALLRSVSEAIPGETAGVPETLSRSVMARIRALPTESAPKVKTMTWGKRRAALSAAAAVVVLASFGVTRLTTMRAGSAAPAEAPMMMAAPAAVMQDAFEEAIPEEEAPAETESLMLFSAYGEEPASAEAGAPAEAPAPEPDAARNIAGYTDDEKAYGAPLAPADMAECEEPDNAANGISPQELLLAAVSGDEPAERPEREADLLRTVDGTDYAFWYEGETLLFARADGGDCFESPLSVEHFRTIAE